jgi:hypothetical protein
MLKTRPTGISYMYSAAISDVNFQQQPLTFDPFDAVSHLSPARQNVHLRVPTSAYKHHWRLKRDFSRSSRSLLEMQCDQAASYMRPQGEAQELIARGSSATVVPICASPLPPALDGRCGPYISVGIVLAVTMNFA